MSNAEKLVKLDMPFQDAIRFFATYKPKQADSQIEESDSTTVADPEPGSAEPQTAGRPLPAAS